MNSYGFSVVSARPNSLVFFYFFETPSLCETVYKDDIGISPVLAADVRING